MDIATKDSTSTGPFNLPASPNACANCPQIISENTGTPTTWGNLESFAHYYADIEKLKKEVKSLQESQLVTSKFYEEGKRLTKTSRIAIIILMTIPVLQLIACAAVVYYLGIQE